MDKRDTCYVMRKMGVDRARDAAGIIEPPGRA